MSSMLGSLLAGAATGAADADIKNTATQNQQTIAENLTAQKAQIEEAYNERLREHQMVLQGAYRSNMSASTEPLVKQSLAAHGLVMQPNAAQDAAQINAQQPGGGSVSPSDAATLPAEARSAYNLPAVASDLQVMTARARAQSDLGYMNPDDFLKSLSALNNEQTKAEAQKEISANNLQNQQVLAKIKGDLSVQANYVRNMGAAGITHEGSNDVHLAKSLLDEAKLQTQIAEQAHKEAALYQYTDPVKAQLATGRAAAASDNAARLMSQIDKVRTGGSGGVLAAPTAPQAPVAPPTSAPIPFDSLP